MHLLHRCKKYSLTSLSLSLSLFEITMLRILCKCKSLTPINKKPANSQTQIRLPLQNFQYLRGFGVGTADSANRQPSFTFRDLINSCGLSDRLAVRSKSSERPDSVLKLFVNCGFTQTQLNAIVSKYPIYFFYDPQRSLKPKIDLFRSVGMSEADVAKTIAISPYILGRSLENHLVPTFHLLTTLLGSEKNAVTTIKHNPRIMCSNGVLKNLAPNLSTLTDLGVSKSMIPKMMNRQISMKLIAGAKPDCFRNVVSAVIEMGFDPRLSSFIDAVIAMACQQKWEKNLRVYGSMGFLDKEILSMFRKQPITMVMSVEKIRRAVEFYLTKFHWSPSRLSASPNVLMYSLEKRIIPRCSVFQVLVSRSKIHKNVNVLTFLVMTDEDFVERYVTTYKDQVPEVLDAYQGKLEFEEYNFDFGRIKEEATAL